MDSLFYCSMGKSRLKATAPISRCPYFLNGKFITKKNFVLYRKNKVLTHRASDLQNGDFCIGLWRKPVA